MNVGIVGCGLIGQKRARALGGCRAGRRARTCRASAPRRSRAASPARRRARRLARRWSSAPTSTSSSWRRPTTRCAGDRPGRGRRRGKHVLVEKPAARRAAELDPVIAAAARARRRWSRSASTTASTRRSARRTALVDEGALGDRSCTSAARYGHGGRLGLRPRVARRSRARRAAASCSTRAST